MKIKKGDNVIVISGKDRGKTGKVIKSFPAFKKVVVEGLNLRTCHEKPKRKGEKGQRIEKSVPMDVSNVMIVDPKTNKRSRVLQTLAGTRPSR